MSPASILQPGRLRRTKEFLEQHHSLLWWLHSVWAFLFGIGVMMLGAKSASSVRIIIFHVTFIWFTSLFLPVLNGISWLSPRWAERVRVAINYFNRNFYQQLLFFVIPTYYASTTLSSRNVLFLLVLCVSALLSTLDVVYDRYLSARWRLAAAFLAFNAFACINVMLSILWSVRSRWALHLSALLALLVLASMFFRFTGLRGRPFWISLGGSALLLLAMVRFGAPFIPPAPLSLGEVTFGREIDRPTLSLLGHLATLPAGYTGRVVALTPVRAPFGLKESIRHRWYVDDRLVRTTSEHEVTGGRKQGYRYWSAITVKAGSGLREIRVDVETGSGQLIGRARLPLAP